ncbi:MAG: type II secretion system GspH family protein [Phycisphaerales bacterium]|nr:type II secretion system GspH family protein [Phycisphaerales bacterium]
MSISKKRNGFTLIELLTVMAIIVLLIGILTPALSSARNQAKKTAVRAQINAMEVGLENFIVDETDYPASNAVLWADDFTDALGLRTDQMTAWEVGTLGGSDLLQGAHILLDALVGRDFLGYDPRAPLVGPQANNPTPYNRWDSANERRQPYIPPDGIGVTSENDPPEDGDGQYPDPAIVQPTIDGLLCRVFRDEFGWPILYYRASLTANQNTPIIQTQAGTAFGDGVFDGQDNQLFTSYTNSPHKIADAPDGMMDAAGMGISVLPNDFAEFIRSFRATTYTTGSLNIQRARPVKSDRFIILSAGKDGIYGNLDDVANFDVLSPER